MTGRTQSPKLYFGEGTMITPHLTDVTLSSCSRTPARVHCAMMKTKPPAITQGVPFRAGPEVCKGLSYGRAESVCNGMRCHWPSRPSANPVAAAPVTGLSWGGRCWGKAGQELSSHSLWNPARPRLPVLNRQLFRMLTVPPNKITTWVAEA